MDKEQFNWIDKLATEYPELLSQYMFDAIWISEDGSSLRCSNCNFTLTNAPFLATCPKCGSKMSNNLLLQGKRVRIL